jgi:hypothetical protein
MSNDDFTLARTPVTTMVVRSSDLSVLGVAICANAGATVKETASAQVMRGNALRKFMFYSPLRRPMRP